MPNTHEHRNLSFVFVSYFNDDLINKLHRISAYINQVYGVNISVDALTKEILRVHTCTGGKC